MPTPTHARRRAATLALAAGAILAAGCDFAVTNPGPILDEQLDVATAIPSLVNGMGGDLSNAIGNYLTRGSLAAFELAHSGNFAAERQFASGVIRAEDVNGDWARLHRARWVAENGLVRMKAVLGAGFDANPNTPRAYLYAGYANRFLGENVCETVIDGGPRVPHTEHFVRAESLFTRALALAGTNAALANAALAGRAQVRVNLGKWDAAVADAALVPVTFRHNAIFSINTTRENMDLAVQTINRREVTVFGTEWVTTPDPRARYDTVRTTTGAFQTGQDGRTRFFRQAKYLTIGDPVPLAKGTEMLLIRAEAALRANDVTAAAGFINQGRAAAALPPLTLTTVAAGWTALMRERGAVLWLEGRRLYDLRRWLAEGRNTQLQGRSSCMPISLEEIGANPNLRTN
ncbi:MAG: RagB/SusD family nutrient uptake outer membrane protein [Gemmatimonadetes bacterium]|nr:RagB/SusD family nutrient uptake outer membrane protein [Gemmatimonadota bacterium]